MSLFNTTWEEVGNVTAETEQWWNPVATTTRDIDESLRAEQSPAESAKGSYCHEARFPEQELEWFSRKDIFNLSKKCHMFLIHSVKLRI